MFLITQFVGLFVISTDSVPSYLDGQIQDDQVESYGYYFFQLVTALILSILIFVLITKYKLVTFMRLWFLLVVIIALSVSFYAILTYFNQPQYLIALAIAIPIGILKIIRPSIIIHNLTEVLIYPGIASIFVPILNPFYAILLLLIISIYDIWAVWHSGIMQKMAKFQMDKMKVFGGFFVPYLTRDIRKKIKKEKIKFKNKKVPKNYKGIQMPIAILGGGDVVFPIITAGVFLTYFNSLTPGLYIIFGAFAGLLYLLLRSEKKKFYPAMPFITAGILLGLAIWGLTLVL